MRKISLLFSLIILFGNAFAQNNGMLKGKVLTADGKPAAAVSATLKGTKKQTLTDDDGNFQLKNIQPGTYSIEVSLVGYETTSREVIIEANKTTNISVSLNISEQQLEGIVVKSESSSFKTGKGSQSLRLQTPLLEVPQNIQVVTANVLKSQQVISMSDGLIRNVSGVTRAEHWGDLYTNISARGSQIQAFRNGFNVVNSYWGPLTEDMSFVENIEFVKGPAGFMLASGDPSGLYNVVTKKPTGETKGEASFTVGSFDLYRATLDLDGKLSKDGKLLYRLNLAAQNKGSFRANEYNDRYAIAPVISYQVDEKTKLTLEYNYQRANMSNVGSYYIFSKDGYGAFPVDATTLPAGLEGTKIDDHSVYLNLQHNFDKNWKVTAQVAQFIYNQVGSSMWPYTINDDGTFIRNVGVWDAESKMKMAQVFVNGEAKTGNIHHRILGGLDMANKNYMADWGQSHDLDTAGAPFDFTHFEDFLGMPANGYPKFDRTTPLEERAQASGGLIDQRYTALYIQDELRFWEDKVRLTLAGRYTDLQQSTYGGAPDKAKHFTPRVGISYSINKETAVYGLYDQAFIPQTGALSNGNKVQPITGNNLEIGVKKDWFGGKWNTTLALYRILKNNELTPDPSLPPTSGLSVELGQKRAEGVEFDLKGTITRGLNLIANYAYTDSKVTKVADGVTSVKVGQEVPGFSKHTVNTWLTYKIQNGTFSGFGASAGFTWLIDRATYWEASPDPNKEMGDYFKLDAGLFWEKDKIKLTANVFNLLDEYLYSGSYESWMAVPMYTYQTEAPRNVRFSISYRF